MVRCKNIIDKKEFGEVEVELLGEEYEKRLFSSVNMKEKAIKDLMPKKDYAAVLAELYGFGEIVDLFFDKVLIMDKDKKVRSNRINLIKKAVDLYLLLADFSRLTIGGNSRI